MATDVSICSNALLMLGAKPINSLTATAEGNADRVLLAANLWPQVRDDLLRAHPWNCAVKRVLLAPEATPPEFDYSASFLLPGDWLRTLQVGEYVVPLDFRQEGRRILCDTTALPLVYVYQNADVGSWDGNLVEVATARMAAAMAYAITQSQAVADGWLQKAEMAFKRAKAVDGQDNPPETFGDFPQHFSRYARLFSGQ
jgi:hypothetical protein